MHTHECGYLASGALGSHGRDRGMSSNGERLPERVAEDQKRDLTGLALERQVVVSRALMFHR